MTTATRRATTIAKKWNWRMVKRRKMSELQGGEKVALRNKRHVNNQVRNMNTYINKECLQRYDFVSDSKLPDWKNKIKALKTIDPEMLELIHPSNMVFHNLSNPQLPMGTQ
jgi:hypothetical protein